MARARRELSPHAQAAKAVRAELKRLFPTTKFSVTSESFAGGDAVNIAWTDGPTQSRVNAAVNQYQEGHFDGMIDLYEYSNDRPDIPQAKYVHGQRRESDERRAEALAYVNRRYGWNLKQSGVYGYENDHHTGSGWASREIGRTLHAQDLSCTCGAFVMIGDAYCAGCGEPLQDDARRRRESEREHAMDAMIEAELATLL
jgi:hypothetical protein